MKNRNRLFALLLSAALMLSVTACGGKSGGSDASAGSSPAAPGASAPAGEQIAEELIVLVGADASTFDPHFCTDSATEIFNKNMYNGLVKFNSDMEILPDLARQAGAAVVGTGRSDFPNQINNVLAFPGIFRGALDVRAAGINDEMKIAAAKAIAGIVSDEELNADYILPAAFDPRVKDAVAAAVAQAARDSGVARI